MTPTVTPTPPSTMDQSIFEGLFTRVLKPTGKFADELRAVGYDPQHPLPRYPSQVWRASLAVACRNAFPELPEDQAQRRLGQMFSQGFAGTIIGKLINVMTPFLSAEMLIKRLPKFATMGSTGIEVSVVSSGPGWWRLRWKDANRVPHFVVGIFEGNISAGSPFSSVELVAEREDGYELQFNARMKQ